MNILKLYYLGLRQPIFEKPEVLLSDHLNMRKRVYENVTPMDQSASKSILGLRLPNGIQEMFCGIATGITQLHEVFFISELIQPNVQDALTFIKL